MTHRKPESFIRQPVFPGGSKAMDEFIKKHLQYPEEAMQHKVEGTVAVEIDIDIFGKVTAARVKHGIGYGCDEEAIRLVNMLQFEKKKYKGMYVVFHKTINIHFRLQDAAAPVQFAYQYKEKKDPTGNSYSYTITAD
jgi:TonB family protein